jgi:hypothetical protein
LRFSYLNIRNSNAALIVSALALIVYLLIWWRADWPAGGQDSWNHLLYARWSLKHPKLMLDQWGKPFFTIPAIPFAMFGIHGLYVFNITCTLLSGWLIYATARKLGMKLPWMASAFFLFQPVVFGNVISGLTEPINALALSYMFYLFAGQRYAGGTIMASLLPFFRSEGFVLMAAVFIFLLASRKWKYLPLLLSGSILYTLITGLITGNWQAILDQNPYLKFETKGEFNPGHGSFFHYIDNFKCITGIAITILMVAALILLAAHIVYLLRKRTPEEKSRFVFWLIAPLFLFFFLAHSYIWWKGSLGSHGLTRVFLVVAPAAALLALYAFDKLLAFDFSFLNKILPISLVIYCLALCYIGYPYPFPWEKERAIPAYPAQTNIENALLYIKNHNLQNHPLVHQMPFINAQLGWDPWASPNNAKTFYLWSIGKDPSKDWLPDSSIILWDGWHAVRDTPLTLNTLRSLKHYKEIAHFPHKDSIYDVRLFIKSNTVE